MRRLRLVLQYDGTGLQGFQRQPDRDTVQGRLEAALTTVCGDRVAVVAAGRTDAGVHALGQVVHLDTTGSIPASRVERAVNPLLEPAIAVRHVEETGPGFHARYSAVERTYHYYVAADRPSPLLARYVLHEERLRPDAAERMRAAAGALLGTHDFAPFCMAGAGTRSTVRSVYRAEVERCGPLLRLELTANGFLWSMVRRITGLLIEVGCGRQGPEAPREALRLGRMPRGARTAPPHGLVLVRVGYPDGYPGAGRGDAGGGPELLSEFGGIWGESL